MKVGDRIRIFEIQDNNGYPNPIIKHKQRPELKQSISLVDLLTKDLSDHNMCFFIEEKEAIHCATMVITKIKDHAKH